MNESLVFGPRQIEGQVRGRGEQVLRIKRLVFRQQLQRERKWSRHRFVAHKRLEQQHVAAEGGVDSHWPVVLRVVRHYSPVPRKATFTCSRRCRRRPAAISIPLLGRCLGRWPSGG